MQHDAPTPPPFEEGLPQELWFSVDVECSGQTPLDGSLISIGACLNAYLLLRGLRRQAIYQPQPGWGGFVLKLALAVYVMGAVLWVLCGNVESWLSAGALERVARLALLVVAGMTAYFGTLWLTGFRLRDFNRRGSE